MLNSVWMPGFDPDKQQFAIKLSANQIAVLHALIGNQYVTEDQQEEIDEDVSHSLACLFDDLVEHVTDNQLHPPCIGGLERMLELPFEGEDHAQ